MCLQHSQLHQTLARSHNRALATKPALTVAVSSAHSCHRTFAIAGPSAQHAPSNDRRAGPSSFGFLSRYHLLREDLGSTLKKRVPASPPTPTPPPPHCLLHRSWLDYTVSPLRTPASPWSTHTRPTGGSAQTVPAPLRGRGRPFSLLTVQRTEGVHPPLSWGVKPSSWPARSDTTSVTSRKATEQEHSASVTPSPHQHGTQETDKLPSMLCVSITCQTHNQWEFPPDCLPACCGGCLRNGGWWPAHPSGGWGVPSYRAPPPPPVQIQDGE